MARAVITFHDDVKQGSPEWLKARKEMYTGSNAHKILNGLGDLNYAKAEESKFKGNFWTKRGHILEDQAVVIANKILSTVIQTTGYVTNSLFPGCLYSPDGYDDEWLYEVKCFSIKKHLELYNVKSVLDIPFKILAQIHYGMLITGKRKAKLIAYNPHFAKKQFIDENGFAVDNPDYDPKKALRIITIRHDKDIANNFKMKLGVANA